MITVFVGLLTNFVYLFNEKCFTVIPRQDVRFHTGDPGAQNA